MKKHITRISLIFAVLISLSGCFTEKQYSGHIIRAENVDRIKVGKTNKAAVYDILGSPSSKGNFGRDIWYYIGDYRTQTAFLDPKVRNRQVVAIHFNPNGNVSKIQKKVLTDGKDVRVAKDTTPSFGTRKGMFEELFGHVGLSPLPQNEPIEQ